MWQKIVNWWNGLPHWLQAIIFAFGGGLVGVLEPVIENWSKGQQVCTVALWPCVATYLLSGVKAGILAVIGLYTKSSLYHRES